MRNPSGSILLIALLSLCVAATGYAPQYGPAPGQQPPPQAAQPGTPMPPQALDNLVAPIALYPDPLLAEVLAASTYPMEVAEAEQWLEDHHKWKPDKLMEEAKKQNWDPSVQGLVAFPQVLANMNHDMNWTTRLGNAFLAQQADVMQAVQRMRQQALAKGTLRSTPQETVSTQNENGQTVITIEPGNPNVWYVPNYNPAYVWGPPAWGYYPPLLYPGIDFGLGWFPGIDLGLYFGGWGGWGWGGWGWMPDWWAGDLFIDHSFFHRYGFRGYWGGAGIGGSVWAHNPAHRLGVPYPNRDVAARYGRNGAFGGEADRLAEARGENFGRAGVPAQHFGNPGFEQRSFTGHHSVFGGYHNGGMARMQSDRGFSSMGHSFGGFGGMHGGGGRR